MARVLPDNGKFKNAFAKLARARIILGQYEIEEQHLATLYTTTLRRVSGTEYAFENIRQNFRSSAFALAMSFTTVVLL